MNKRVDHGNETAVAAAERIYHEWDAALASDNIDALLALYTDDVIIESPLIPYLLGTKGGVCQGKAELKKLLELVAERKPIHSRKYARVKYFTDGKTLMWEYPRLSAEGEQMDFVEVMELEHGLIKHHKVYWGWYGFNIIKEDKYYKQF